MHIRPFPFARTAFISITTGILVSPVLAMAAPSSPALETTPQSTSTEQRRTERVIDKSHYYFGGNLGVGLISEGGGGHPQLGAVAGLHFNSNFSAGFFFSRVPRGSFTSLETNGTAIGGAINYYGLEGQYHVAAIPGLQLGPKIALGTNSVDVNGGSTSSTEFYFGPKAAYDYAISDSLTLGVEGNVLFGSADQARSSAMILAALKFWIA